MHKPCILFGAFLEKKRRTKRLTEKSEIDFVDQKGSIYGQI
jgi:hypothetical protein